MDGRVGYQLVFPEGRGYAAGEVPPPRRLKFVSPGYFQTMGTRMMTGRELAWADIYGRAKVAVISENFAREVWGSAAAAIGKRIHGGTAANAPPIWREIVGVVEDVHEDGLHQEAPSMVYWPA